MAKRPLNKEFPIRRVFLRVPIKSSAKVFIEQGLPQEVDLNDISSGGISFFAPATFSLSDYFKIEFHLEPGAKPITATLAVKSRVAAGDKLRIGCNFFQINEADKSLITRYICSLTNLTKPLRVLARATFLCCVDALWRIPAYFLYCRGVEFERLSKVSFFVRLYFFVLLLYCAAAVCGFILSGRPAERLGKSRFLFGLACLLTAFIFVALKSVRYLSSSIGNPFPLFLDVFIWAYLIFAAYIGYAVILSLVWTKKIDAASQILERHSAYAA